MALWGGEIDWTGFRLVQPVVWTCLDWFVSVMLQIRTRVGLYLESTTFAEKGIRSVKAQLKRNCADQRCVGVPIRV
jgi:hypothetical protein